MQKTFICCLVFLAVSHLPAEAGQDKLQVVVSILPQAWFVEQIGGDLVEVAVLVGPGHSPATFEPTPKQLAHLQGADLYVSAGVPFETGLLPRIKSMSRGPHHCGNEPPAGDAHGHHHGIDPHTWLDPAQAVVMAEVITAELSRLAPSSAAQFSTRVEKLREQMGELDLEIKALLAPYSGRELFVFHPAFGHFAAAYGLVQIAVEDHGHEPGPRQLATVIEHAKSAGAQAIIVQPQFSQKAAGTVARSAGLEVVVLDPLGDQYDSNLRHIAVTLADLFSRNGKTAP